MAVSQDLRCVTGGVATRAYTVAGYALRDRLATAFAGHATRMLRHFKARLELRRSRNANPATFRIWHRALHEARGGEESTQ